jgi:CPA2 family monovalent cation:H+ antiporter-2
MGDELKIIWLLTAGLGLACLFGYVAQRYKQSPILGYLLAGYLLGPNSPGIVVDSAMSEQLAVLGVTLLMFAVGLNFNWQDLIAVKRIAIPGAITLSFLSALAGTLYSVYLGEAYISGLVIGLAVCVSSTVVIVRVLSDKGILHSPQGHIVLGWTIVEDLISVFGLLLLPALITGGADHMNSPLSIPLSIGFVFVKVFLLGFIIHFFGQRMIEVILKTIARTRSHELFTLVILATTFLIAIGSSYLFGVSLALGAFIAGTIVGKTEMSHQAAANALPMRDAFAVIFFVSVGMLFDPFAVGSNLPLFLGVIGILLLFRPLIAFTIVKRGGYGTSAALTVAIAISQIGEYSFILAEEGSNLGILPDNAFDILVASAFVTIGINPILFQLFRSYCNKQPTGKKLKDIDTSGDREMGIIEQTKGSQASFLPRVIIIGFGPVGQEVRSHLKHLGYNTVVIDRNVDTIAQLLKQNVEAIFGDATQFSILEKAEVHNSPLLVITTPEYNTGKLIVKTARNINPFIKIVMRARFESEMDTETISDVSIVCDEKASSEKFVEAIRQLISSYAFLR